VNGGVTGGRTITMPAKESVKEPGRETVQQQRQNPENSSSITLGSLRGDEDEPLPPKPGLISSRVAALRTGMGKFTFFRAVRALGMQAAVDKRARFWFTTDQIDELSKYARRDKNPGGRPKGKLDQAEASALAFLAFEEGMAPARVVIDYQMPPYLVKQLYQAWMELKDGFVVTGEDRKAIEALAWKKKVFDSQSRSVPTAKVLLELLRSHFSG
jgi:hypothetical protein